LAEQFLKSPSILPVDGDLIKIMSWYDNEWGYANQMIREILPKQN
jgi:glyceraldehyde 3-phosphate dehydrogenase